MKSKENKKNNWYKNLTKSEIIYKSILFVPPTPGSGLLKEIKQREMELNGHRKDRIKFVEKGGLKVGQILTKKNLSRKKNAPKNGAQFVMVNLEISRWHVTRIT